MHVISPSGRKLSQLATSGLQAEQKGLDHPVFSYAAENKFLLQEGGGDSVSSVCKYAVHVAISLLLFSAKLTQMSPHNIIAEGFWLWVGYWVLGDLRTIYLIELEW